MNDRHDAERLSAALVALRNLGDLDAQRQLLLDAGVYDWTIEHWSLLVAALADGVLALATHLALARGLDPDRHVASIPLRLAREE